MMFLVQVSLFYILRTMVCMYIIYPILKLKVYMLTMKTMTKIF